MSNDMRKLMKITESYMDDPNRPGWKDEEGNWNKYEDCPTCNGWGEYIPPGAEQDIDNVVACPDCADDLGPAAQGKSKIVKQMGDEADAGWTVKDFPLAEDKDNSCGVCGEEFKWTGNPDDTMCQRCTKEYEQLDEDAGHSIKAVLSKDEIADLLRDLEQEGDIIYGASYFDKLYFHFLDTHPDEIPVGHRTGRPDNVEEYVLDNIGSDYGVELEAMISHQLDDRRHGLGEGDPDDTDWDAHWAREDGDDERADDLEADAEFARMDDELDEGAKDDECTRCFGLGRHPGRGGEDCPECKGTGKCPKVEEDLDPDGMGHYEVVVRRGTLSGGDDNVHEDVVSGPLPLDQARNEARSHVRQIRSECETGSKVKKGYLPTQESWAIRFNSHRAGESAGAFVFIRQAEDADVEAWFGENIELTDIVESVLQEFEGQPRDYEMSDDEVGAEAEKEFEKDRIDPEIEDEELGLRFD